jgi:hypothetical protein
VRNILENPTYGRWFAPGVIAVITIGIVAIINHQKHAPLQAVPVLSSQMSSEEYQAKVANPNQTVTLVFKNEQLVSGPSTITVNQNDSVNITLQNESSEEIRLDLDGYGIHTEADNSGGDGGFNFLADQIGTFPFYVEQEDENADPFAPNPTPPVKIKVGTIVVR